MPPANSKKITTPTEYIEAHGNYKVGTVVAIWSAGESDLGGETYLFLDKDNHPFTALEIGDRFIVHEGWGQFNPRYVYD